MIYLNDSHILELGMDWRKLLAIVEDVIRIKDSGDYAQPLKPYLRFGELVNRIIAMPAYVGGSCRMSGIKWVSSFPMNSRLGLPRAHNTVILNNPDTGEPIAFIHSGLLNGMRTSTVSGLMLEAFITTRRPGKLRIGIIGWGPVGRLHLEMCINLFGELIERISLFDLKGIDPDTIPPTVRLISDIADNWRSVYRSSNVFITCTAASERYIDEAPPAEALLLNVSLRDYLPVSVAQIRVIVIDDWLEVCRENTDVEQLQLCYGLIEADTCTLEDVLCRNKLADLPMEGPVFFNPMGLAIFDIGIADYYLREALRLGVGLVLE